MEVFFLLLLMHQVGLQIEWLIIVVLWFVTLNVIPCYFYYCLIILSPKLLLHIWTYFIVNLFIKEQLQLVTIDVYLWIINDICIMCEPLLMLMQYSFYDLLFTSMICTFWNVLGHCSVIGIWNVFMVFYWIHYVVLSMLVMSVIKY
jgi:hypothetical protein